MLANVSAHKKIALKLYALNWFERRRLLKSFTTTQTQQIKYELTLLKQIKVENVDELLAQVQANKNVVSHNKSLFTNVGFSTEVLNNINELLVENKKRVIAPALVLSINEFSKKHTQGKTL